MIVWLVMRDFGFVLAALIYGVSVAAGALYYARFRNATRAGMAGRRKEGAGRPNDFDWVGALPAHAVLGCLALALWLIPLMGLLVVRYTDPPAWWGMPFVIAGELALLASLWSVVRYELRVFR